MKKCFTLTAAAAIVAMAAQSVSAEEIEYKTLGMGWMTDDMITQMLDWEPVTYKVEIQQAEDNSALYRVIAPYGQAFADAVEAINNKILTPDQFDSEGKCYIDIDATDPDDVIFHKTMTGFDIGAGELFIGVNSSYNLTLKDGVISGPVLSVAVGIGDAAVAANRRGKFRIVMPGVDLPDYDIAITPDNHCLTDRTFKGNLKIGEGIATVRYAVVPEMQEDEMVSYVRAVAKDGGVFTWRDDFSYEMDEVYKETLIVVGLNASDDMVGYDWCTYYYIDEDPDGWRDSGMAEFTDGFLQDLISNIPSQTTECMLQQSIEEPGRYRLVDPYAGIKEFGALSAKHKDHHHYIYINATEPECIYIEESPIGMESSQYGLMRVSSQVDYYIMAGFMMDEILELELGGIVEDGVLTFPEEALMFSMLKFDNGDWWYTDSDGATAIKLPEGIDITTGIANITTDASEGGATEYFDLQGIRVTNPQAGKLYIKRQGTKSSKVVM